MLGFRAAGRAVAIAARSRSSAAFAAGLPAQRATAAAVGAAAPQLVSAVSARAPVSALWVRPVSASACASALAGPRASPASHAVAMSLMGRFMSTKASEAGGAGEQSDAAKGPDGGDPAAASGSSADEEPQDKAGDDEGKGGKEGEDGEDDDDARYEQGDSLPTWQIVLWLAGLGLAGWFGSVTVMELLPTATAPQSIRQRAVSVLEGDPDVVERFGKVARSYGAGYGGERGRRNFVQSYSYSRGGDKYTRIKFMVETDEKRKGVVYAEVAHSAPRDWVYLMLERGGAQGGSARRRQRNTVVVVDNRRPEKPLAVRQREVVGRLLSMGARLYHGGPLDAHGQGQMGRFGAALGESERTSLLVDCSRDANERRCEDVGFAKGQSPIWTVRVNGQDVTRRQKVLELEDVEAMLGMDKA